MIQIQFSGKEGNLMTAIRNFFASRWGIVSAGVFVGVFAAVLQKLGNPGNMGICVACMERDIAGALGLHRAALVQYIRPEIIAFVLGAFIAALLFREFKPRGGSSPILRFFLGFFAMIGALVFLGCPWRALLRLAGGDGNAILGLARPDGRYLGGGPFPKIRIHLGSSYKSDVLFRLGFSNCHVGFLVLLLVAPQLEERRGEPHGSNLFQLKGSRFATRAHPDFSLGGPWRGIPGPANQALHHGGNPGCDSDQEHSSSGGILGIVVAAFIMNLVLGQFKAGFTGQPIAHTDYLWNFMGMALSGLAFALAGGCPGRQLFLSGEGDGDAAIFATGMIVGAGFSHNFSMASSATGPGPYGPIAVIIGLIFCIVVGFTMREKMA